MTARDPRNLAELLVGAQLPALPQSAIRLLELSQDLDNGPAEYAVPIEADPGLTGQVLRFVNSSYFGFAREISSVKLAISLVGTRTIKNFALWSAVFSLMPNPKCGPFDLKSLWQDSLRRALFARLMGRLMGLKEAEDLFAAALLQDMAVPLLARELTDRYVRLLGDRGAGQVRLSDLERDAFGWTHAEAAALMARGWRLPESFADLIEQHTEFSKLRRQSRPDISALAVSLSALLPSCSDCAWGERQAFVTAYDELAGPKAPQLAQVLRDVDAGFEQFAPVLKLAIPSRPLADCLQGEVATCSA